MKREDILSKIILERPERIKEPYSWIKHIPLAFFLIDVLRPEVFVELGVHTGNSFCAFCQAVKKLKLKTKCYAVDTWKGDELSGLYEDEIYADLNTYINDNYKNTAKLLRMTFEEASTVFKDKSVDLLHIDGSHSYDDVKKDFEAWLPKLSDQGVIIIHDISVKEEGYGVWRFWEEISNRYLSSAFEHGYGLGIAVVGSKVSQRIRFFIEENNKDTIYKTLFNRLGKLIYLEKKEPITKLFIDCGSGFAEHSSIAKQIDLSEEFISAAFDLNQFSNIRALRWDPLENAWCIVKLKSISYQDKAGITYHLDLQTITHNGQASEDYLASSFAKKLYGEGWLIFDTIDPQIFIPVQGDLTYISFDGKIKVIDQIYIEEHYRNKMQINRPQNSEASSQQNPSSCKSSHSENSLESPKLQFNSPIDHSIMTLAGFVARLRHNCSIRVLSTFVRGIEVLRKEGLHAFSEKVKDYFRIKKEILLFSKKPTISIIMPVYNVEEKWLKIAINSVIGQLYPKWELCIADDASTAAHIRDALNRHAAEDPGIKITFQKKNNGISATSNNAVQKSSGEYLAFMDHDDELTSDALYEIVKLINSEDPDIIYSDEEMIDGEGAFLHSHFKPDFSPDLLFSHNYITHFLVVRKSLFHEIGGFRSPYDGAQDFDLILRLSEKTDKIGHVPKTLYRWRQNPSSVSINPESKQLAVRAGQAALQATLERRKIQGKVELINSLGYYRVKAEIQNRPLISVIIPSKDQSQLLKACIDSILHKTSFQNYEIICINNNSINPETFELIDNLRKLDPRLRFIDYDIPFNFSRINNYGVSLAKGEHIILMNNDIEVINNDWIEALLEHSQREEIGAVGAKLYYPNDTIQHAGVIVGIAGHAGHSHKYYKREEKGYFFRLMCIQNVSAVTGALLMVKKKLYHKVGGLDEYRLTVSLNDIDFCLKLLTLGYLNIFTPYCEAYHHESASRGYETTPEKSERFKTEIGYFRERWRDFLAKGDPYYNVNLTLEREDFSLRP